MNKNITDGLGYCGLNCYSCPINKATCIQDKSEHLKIRTEIARICSEEYGLMYNTEDITDCHGCTTDNEILFPGCRICKIRSCARGRGNKSCALCPEFICDILEEFYIKELTGKINLEKIINNLQ